MIRPYLLSELAAVLGGQLIGENVDISGISIDSRTIQPGNLFIAIKGPNFDGHAYVQKAFESGAVAVLVQEAMPDCCSQIVVEDTQKALGLLGKFNRHNSLNPLVAVTGTCGKTSVKEMLSAILAEQGKTMATEGNFNNAFGVPLTLFRLDSDDQYAVVELGTSSPGEIEYITSLAEPDVAIITNASENHLKDLISLEGVIHEKGFILEGLKSNGKAVLNLDDPSYKRWEARALAGSEREVLSFSLLNAGADCFASDIVSSRKGMTFTLHLKSEAGVLESAPVTIKFWGAHQVLNACCSALAARTVGLSLQDIVVGLERAKPFQRRGTRYALSEHVLVIDESYNASPIATRAAIDQLTDCDGRTILALGDMLDLRDVTDEKHREIGAYARAKNVGAFAGFGTSTALAVTAFW